eukprot:m.182512 g.182512  ORF g.182512 m.182512 type:complete len:66 (+) comp39295_c0_seq10:2017-2214(+)
MLLTSIDNDEFDYFQFKEVFCLTIENLVVRIHNNYAFQIIPNTFLMNPNTSAIFCLRRWKRWNWT